MVTLGTRGCPILWGVPAPPAPAPAPPVIPPGPPNIAPAEAPDAPCWGCREPLLGWPSAEGAFLRASASWVWDEDGVTLAGELAPCEGDAVPEFESFFLDDLLPSFALESCSC